MKLIRLCTARLEDAELRVKQLQLSADGDPVLAEFGKAEEET